MRALAVATAALLYAIVVRAQAGQPGPGSSVIPRPRTEKLTGQRTVVSGLRVEAPGEAARGASGALRAGRELLRARLEALGLAERRTGAARVVLRQVSDRALAEALGKIGAKEAPDPGRLGQAYVLRLSADEIAIDSAGPLGQYYALASLCQLLEKDAEGGVSVPLGAIADWPEVALRLAKTSASSNPPEKVAAFAGWLPLMKMNLIGLQFHGGSSKRPDANFTRNLEANCRGFRKQGVLESIVYFCPFRGRRAGKGGAKQGAYDFSQDEDRRAYAEYLRWIMSCGAAGIEVDYNDWPGSREVPIAEVIELACKALQAEHPEAYVLYCPPATGRESYRGMATRQMGDTLAQVPPKVWPLWTGMTTLITRPLKAEQVEQWTRIAGRRPFLWVNRVSLGVASHFARPVPQAGGACAFRGEYLPRDLGRLFEGVHFNAGISKGYNRLSGQFADESIAYLATAADYVWNPRDWSPAESCRRAERFVEVMRPLVKSAGTKPGAAGGTK